MARKRLNKGVVGALTFCVSVGALVVAGVWFRRLQRIDSAHFVQLAEQFRIREQWPQAALFYRKAWEVGQNPGHLVSFGSMLLNDGDVGHALLAWNEALIKDPTLVEAHRARLDVVLELATLYGRKEDWKRVIETCEKMLDTEAPWSATDQALAHHALGLALAGQGPNSVDAWQTSLNHLGRAVELDGTRVSYAVDLALTELAAGRNRQGEERLRRLVATHTDPGAEAARSRIALASYLARTALNARDDTPEVRSRLDEAEATFREALRLAEGNPDDLYDARMALAIYLTEAWGRGTRITRRTPRESPGPGTGATPEGDSIEGSPNDIRFSEAERLLRSCIETHPERFDASLQLAALFQAFGKKEEAVNVCAARLERGFQRRGVQAAVDKLNAFRLMLLASEAGMSLAAEATSSDLDQRDRWLARARAFLEQAKGEFPGHPRLLSQEARIALVEGHDRRALEGLRRAESVYLTQGVVDWDNKVVLARLHLRLDEPGAARDVLDKVLEEQPGTAPRSAWLVLAEALLEGGELDNPQLERALARVEMADPGNERVRELRTNLLIRKGRLTEAQASVPPGAVAILLKAREQDVEHGPEAAIQVLLDGLAEYPGDLALMGGIVPRLIASGRQDQADTLVQDALRTQPDHPYLKRLAVLTKPGLNDEQRLDAVIELFSGEPDGFIRAWNLAELQLKLGHHAQALPLINEAERHLVARDTPAARLATTGQDRILLRMKMLVGSKLNDDAVMQEARDAAEARDSDGTGGHYFVGLYHLARQEFDAAALAFRSAVAAQPTHVRSLTALAQCLLTQGQVDEAERLLQRVLKVSADEMAALKGLAAIARERRDASSFDRYFAAAERVRPDEPWVREEQLRRKEEADPAAAIAAREARLARDPDDPDNLLRLSALCESTSDLTKADEYLQRARVLRPDDRDLVIALGKYYRRTGRPEKALESVTAYAESRATPESRADASVLIAAHHLSRQELDRAEETLLAAARITETEEVCLSLGEFYLRSRRDGRQAVIWLDKALAIGTRNDSSRLGQSLTLKFAAQLTRDSFDPEGASKTIEDYHARFPRDPRDQLWASELHAAQGRLDRAVEAISRYLQVRPQDSAAVLKRAQLNVALGRTPAAIGDLESLKGQESGIADVEPRLMLAQLYARSGHRDLWLRELETLAQSAPDDPQVIEALSTAYARSGRPADADQLITTWINRSNTAPDPRWYVLRGAISFELGQPDRALDDFRRAAELSQGSPASVTRVLDAYLQTGRFAEGIEYRERNRQAATSRVESRYARLLAGASRSDDAVAAFRQAMRSAIDEDADALRAVTQDLRLAFPRVTDAMSLFESEANLEDPVRRANDRILARLYRLAGRPVDAQARIEKLLTGTEQDAERTALYLELAEHHQQTGQFDLARKAYESALGHDPDHWVALNNLAYVLSVNLGAHAEALPYAKAAVRLADTPDTLDTLGWIYVQTGALPSAISELSRAIRLNPDMLIGYLHLGEAYRRNRQFLEAEDVLKSGLSVAEEWKDAAAAEQINKLLERAKQRDASTESPPATVPADHP